MLYMSVSGPKRVSDMGKVCKSGKTGVNMRATGNMTWLTAKVGLFTQTAMFMKESG